MGENKVEKMFGIVFIIGILIIFMTNDPEKNKKNQMYESELNNPKNIQSEKVKVSAFEQHSSGYNLLLKVPTGGSMYVYLEGYKEKYKVPYLLSTATSEGSEFEVKYVIINNEKCVLSISSVANPEFIIFDNSPRKRIFADSLIESKHHELCKLMK